MNRPVFLSSFIGRKSELDEIEARLSEGDARLLTLTGPGGSGKTRLAHQATENLSKAYEDGIAWVDLVGVDQQASLPGTLGAGMGISPGPDQSMLEALESTLAARETLIVLDNCEHIADACGELVGELLGACPTVSFLATSRTALNVQGEQIWRVPPMSHPSENAAEESLVDYDAVKLFVARARQIRPHFELRKTNRQGLIQILELLDGQPLAIELAAARLNVLEIPQIVDRLSDQLRFLSDRAEMMGARHRSIGAAIRWSHELLSEDESTLFRRLGVFEGTFSLRAVEEVCGFPPLDEKQILDLMDGLIRQSLVNRVGANQGETRFRLLESIRQFAVGELRDSGQEPQLKDRHQRHYSAIVLEAEGHMQGPEQREWSESLDEDYENIQEALRWLLKGAEVDVSAHLPAARLTRALFWPWNYAERYEEAIGWYARALSLDGLEEKSELYADLLRCRATFVWLSGDYPQAQALLAQSIEISADIGYEYCLGHAILLLGIIELHEKQVEGAIRKLNRSEAIFVRLKEPRELSIARTNLGSAFMEIGDLSRAREYAELALAAARANDDVWAQGLSLQMLGNIVHRQGEVQGALPLMEEALELLGMVGQHWLSAETLWRQALILRETGDLEGAIRQLQRCFELSRDIGALEWQLSALESLGSIAIEQGHKGEAVGYFREVLRSAQGDSLAHIQARVLLGVIELSLGAEEWAWAAEIWGAYEQIRDAQQLPSVSEEARIRERIEPRLSKTELEDAYRWGRALSLEEATERSLEHLYRLETRALVTAPRHDLRLLGLGPTDVYRRGKQLAASDWTYAKPKELLFYLASNTPKTKEQIGLAFWPDASQEQLRAGLRAALYHLRRALGDRAWILYEDGHYRFNQDMDYWYDLEGFNSNLERGERLMDHSPGEAMESFERAVDLYRGDFLADIAEDEWASLQRESLRRRYFEALFTLSELLLAAERVNRAVEVLNLLVAEDPLLEKAHRALMRCYALKGEHALIRRQYQGLKETMADELGVDPSPDTSRLFQSLISAESRG